MIQENWLPIICNRTRPAPATAAADFIGIDDATSHRWLCKGQSKHALLPATEWICSHLASACGLPVPPVAVVELSTQPGVPYFGSQWQSGALEYLQVVGRITNADVFQRTHAVDLFINNVDRHMGNYLYLDLAGEVVARVIDFSHSFFVLGWPLPPLPMSPCHTMNCLPTFLAQNPLPYQRPQEIINRIAALPDEWMRNTLDSMPIAWLQPSSQIILRQWWVGAARQKRLTDAQSALP